MNANDPGTDPVQSYLQRYGKTGEVQAVYDPNSEFNRVRFAKSLSPMERLSTAFVRGAKLGGTLGFTGQDDFEDPAPGRLDATDVASAVGQVVGSVPAALLSAGIMNPVVARLGIAAAPQAAGLASRLGIAAARNVVQGAPLTAIEAGRQVHEGASAGGAARVAATQVAADAILGGLTHGLARGKKAKLPVGEGGESIPARALPPGQYEMPSGVVDAEMIPHDAARTVVDGAAVIEPRQIPAPASRLAIPAVTGPEGPVQRFGPDALETTFVATPEGVAPVAPVTRQIPAQTGPYTPPAPAGSVLDPNRVDRLASGAVNQVVRRTPPPTPTAPVPTEVAARLAAEPALPLEMGAPEIPPAVASRLATPAVPEERLVAPAPEVPQGPVLPRLRSNAATAYAQQAAAAASPQEAFAVLTSAATDPKVGPTDRAPLTQFIQQRLDALGGVPEPAPRPANTSQERVNSFLEELDNLQPRPAPRPKPPVPAPAEGGQTVKVEPKPETPQAPSALEVDAPRATEPVPAPEVPEPTPPAPREPIAAAAGRETDVRFSDGGTVQGRYAWVDLDNVQTSHDPFSFQKLDMEAQGRAYHTDRAAQEFTAEGAAKLDADRLLDRGDLINAGPPASDLTGKAFAGHGRVMMMKRAASAHPERWSAYQQAARERAPEFGLGEPPEGMKRPAIMRLVDTEGMNVRELNARSDQEVGKVKDVLSDAATRARGLTHDSPALTHLSETMGTEETLRSYLKGASGRQFVTRLIEEGVIGKTEVPRFLDARTNTVTEEGAQVIERTLLAAAVGDADVVGRAPAGVLAKLEHAVPAIVRTQRVQDFNLGVGLREALDLLAEKQSGGFKSLDDLLGQGDMFSGPREVPALTKRLAEFLDSAKPSEVKAAFRGLLSDAQDAAAGQGDLLGGGGPKTFSESFRERFKTSTAGQTLHNEFGFAMLHPLGSIVGGGVGAAYGYTLGETPQDRLQNAALYGTVGLALGLGSVAGASGALQLARSTEKSSLRKMADHIFKDGTDWMRSLGASGTEMAGGVARVARAVEQRVGTDMEDLHRALKGVSKSDRLLLGRIMNRRPIPELENKIPRRLMDKVQEIRAILDRSMNEFGEVGGVRRNLEGESLGAPMGSGKAFPQVPNEAGRDFLKEAALRKGASPRVAELAQRMVKRGEAVDFEDAVDRIIQYANRGQRGITGYLESTRFELPEEYVEWDPTKVLPGVIEKSWRTVEGFREWGQNMGDAKKLLARVGQEAGADQQVKLETWFAHTFGAAGRQDVASANILGAVSNYETISKLGLSLFSMVRNAGQVLTNTADLPWQAQMKAFRDLPPVAHAFMKGATQIKEGLRRSGAVSNRSVLSELENRAPLAHASNVAMKGFLHTEGMNQYRTALAARYTLERDLTELSRLKGVTNPVEKVWNSVRSLSLDPEGTVARRIQRMAPSEAQAKEWLSGQRSLTEDEIAAVMWKANNDRNFAANLATEPIWWSTNPAARLAFKFKRFGIKQAGYIWNHVAKEVAKGNVAPLTKFMLATMVAGETYHIARDLLLGEDESVTGGALQGKALGGRLLNNLKDGGAFGFASDLLWGVGDYVGGPAMTTGAAATKAIADGLRRPTDAKQWALSGSNFLRREVSSLKQADAIVQHGVRAMGDESNRYFEASRLRTQARSFREEQQGTGERVKAGAIKMVEGVNPFPSFERTLTYRYAAKQVDVGDVGDAATYLAGLIRDAKDRTERATIIDGMYASMEAQSPLGPLNQEEQAKLLRTLPVEERERVRTLDRTWRRDYQQAIRQAVRQAR